MLKAVSIRGGREHNLKKLDVGFPRDRLTVMTGLSGSGRYPATLRKWMFDRRTPRPGRCP
ncbi:MAG: hypothetical protein KGJ78_15030 [Alphaproteobacteria bacterium]|nr:hypothetical protein [Alphaproteobacteria bacterium]